MSESDDTPELEREGDVPELERVEEDNASTASTGSLVARAATAAAIRTTPQGTLDAVRARAMANDFEWRQHRLIQLQVSRTERGEDDAELLRVVEQREALRREWIEDWERIPQGRGVTVGELRNRVCEWCRGRGFPEFVWRGHGDSDCPAPEGIRRGWGASC
jgi:hypothetical protein